MGIEGQFKNDLRAGYVYVLSSREKPGVVRIGSTMRDLGKTRHEPFGTLAPVDCDVEFSLHVPDRIELERVLQRRFADRLLPGGEQFYALAPEEAIAGIVEETGMDYTNARVTGILFKKHVQILQRKEASLRGRRRSLAVMTGELTELRDKLRDCEATIARSDNEIARLRGEIAALSKARWRDRIVSLAAGTLVVVVAAGTIALT